MAMTMQSIAVFLAESHDIIGRASYFLQGKNSTAYPCTTPHIAVKTLSTARWTATHCVEMGFARYQRMPKAALTTALQSAATASAMSHGASGLARVPPTARPSVVMGCASE
jgi:hypothetical protein